MALTTEQTEAAAKDPMAAVKQLEGEMQKKMQGFIKMREDEGKTTTTTLTEESVPPIGTDTPKAPDPAPEKPKATPAMAPAPEQSDVPEAERPPSGASKATKEDWSRFRAFKNAERDKLASERDQLRKELEDLKKGASTNGIPQDEYARLKAENEQLNALVERTSLENSPRFRNAYDGKIETEWKVIRENGGEHGAEIEKLLKNGNDRAANTRLREILGQMNEFDAGLIRDAYGRIRRLDMEKREQLGKAQENMKLLRAREQTESLEHQTRTAAQRKATADSIIAQAKELPEFKSDPTNTDHQQFTTTAMDFIRQAAMGELDPTDVALLPVAAMKARYLEDIRLPSLVAENEALKARIAKLTGASPKVDGQTQTPAETPNNKLGMTPQTFDPQKATKAIADKYAKLMGQ